MNHISLAEFLEKPEKAFCDTVEIEELTTIHSEKGNVVLMSETAFESLMQALGKRKE